MERKSLLQEFYSDLLFVENHGKLTAETYLICVQEFLDYLEKNETPLEKVSVQTLLYYAAFRKTSGRNIINEQKFCLQFDFFVRF